MNLREMTITLNRLEGIFFETYIEALHFTERGDADASDDPELDETFLRESLIDCLAFYSRVGCYLADNHVAIAGLDFWHCRNGIETSVRERKVFGWAKQNAERFTKLAEGFGEVDALFEESI